MGLCGCSALAITGEFGTIVAHIGPNPATFKRQMEDIQKLFKDYIQGQQAKIYLFEPAENGVPVFPPFANQIQNWLIKNIGLGIARSTVEKGNADDPAQRLLGTLLLQLAQGALYMWINNQRVTRVEGVSAYDPMLFAHEPELSIIDCLLR